MRFDVIASNPPYVPDDSPDLARLKHEPRSALAAGADGLDAIRKFAASEHDVDLVLTDVMMPNASGKTVCEAVHAENPDMPVIFLTGHGDGIIDKQFLADHRAKLLNKPLQSAELLSAIASSLAESSVVRHT